jgi:hypothetical protein
MTFKNDLLEMTFQRSSVKKRTCFGSLDQCDSAVEFVCALLANQAINRLLMCEGKVGREETGPHLIKVTFFISVRCRQRIHFGFDWGAENKNWNF